MISNPNSTTEQRPTPRCDSQWILSESQWPGVIGNAAAKRHLDFARTLERELAEMREVLAALVSEAGAVERLWTPPRGLMRRDNIMQSPRNFLHAAIEKADAMLSEVKSA